MVGVKVSVGVNVSVGMRVNVGVKVSVGINVDVGVSVHAAAMAVSESAVAVARDSADCMLQEARNKIGESNNRKYIFI